MSSFCSYISSVVSSSSTSASGTSASHLLVLTTHGSGPASHVGALIVWHDFGESSNATPAEGDLLSTTPKSR